MRNGRDRQGEAENPRIYHAEWSFAPLDLEVNQGKETLVTSNDKRAKKFGKGR